ncbi:MAG TPA: RNA polymerase sigma-70 factor [Chitinophagaceae bacterium]|nr:RNA polymerase sigma-70 factor [Chitinophagaceae bacterium]
MRTESSYEEKELLQGLQSGQESAFRTIYEKYASALIHFAAARLSSLEEAKDLIHDLFVYLWEEKENIHITHSLQAFLFAAVRYRIIDRIRHDMIREKYAASLQGLPGIEKPEAENNLASKELQSKIENAVNELPPRVREVYQLSRDKHYSIAEIAAELNLSPQTVKNQLTTALSHLRSALKSLILLLFW